MILLLGGASETAPIAQRLAEMGHTTLVSTATDVELDVGTHPNIRRRRGRLDAEGIARLIRENSARAVVDATHPYAVEARANARAAASMSGVPYLTYVRPGETYDYENIAFANDHEEAAAIAVSFGRPILLTTGSRNVAPYVHRAKEAGVTLVARVLDHPDSLAACRKAGAPEEMIIAERGPFTVEQNLSHIARFGIGVLVTKDSGAAGGVADKIEAARRSQCQVVMVKRPDGNNDGAYDDIDELIEAVKNVLASSALQT